MIIRTLSALLLCTSFWLVLGAFVWDWQLAILAVVLAIPAVYSLRKQKSGIAISQLDSMPSESIHMASNTSSTTEIAESIRRGTKTGVVE